MVVPRRPLVVVRRIRIPILERSHFSPIAAISGIAEMAFSFGGCPDLDSGFAGSGDELVSSGRRRNVVDATAVKHPLGGHDIHTDNLL